MLTAWMLLQTVAMLSDMQHVDNGRTGRCNPAHFQEKHAAVVQDLRLDVRMSDKALCFACGVVAWAAVPVCAVVHA